MTVTQLRTTSSTGPREPGERWPNSSPSSLTPRPAASNGWNISGVPPAAYAHKMPTDGGESADPGGIRCRPGASLASPSAPLAVSHAARRADPRTGHRRGRAGGGRDRPGKACSDHRRIAYGSQDTMTDASRHAEPASPAAHGGAQRWLDHASGNGRVLDIRPEHVALIIIVGGLHLCPGGRWRGWPAAAAGRGWRVGPRRAG
jgi:hypothetical protein